MESLGEAKVIDWVLRRAASAKSVNATWLTTSTDATNDSLVRHVESRGVPVFRGSEADVLGRFAEAAAAANAEIIVRITGDCPFIDPDIIDEVVMARANSDADYATNTNPPTFPDGLDVEVFTRAALDIANEAASEPFLREHVTPYISGKRRDLFPSGQFERTNVTAPADYGFMRWTIDTANDLEFCRTVAASLDEDFRWQDLIAFLLRNPDVIRLNIGQERNASTDLAAIHAAKSFSESDALFQSTLKIIPLASQTFSKSYQQWVVGAAPLFLERGRGGRVWDVDGNAYIDYVLGLMPLVLGYCDPDVDAAISEQLHRGITFSLPHRLEAEVAERLVRLIPCAESVRFGKNGSDATTAAIRLARARTGRHKVAIGGYHGWHDWYIGSTTRHIGVPDEVRKLSATFRYNDADSLESLLKTEPDAYAAIILEPVGATMPAPGFLERVRELADQYGALLVFDEIVTGFRINLGGAQAELGVLPDLACFGKAMANGMPVSAIVGRKAHMNAMEDIFFSGTFGGETLSLAAAAATIDKLERLEVPMTLRGLGKALIDGAKERIQRCGLQDVIGVSDVDWWPRLSIIDLPIAENLLTSLMRQEFVQEGLLLGSSFNMCLPHSNQQVHEATLTAFERAMETLSDHLNAPDPATRLRGSMIQPTFSVRATN